MNLYEYRANLAAIISTIDQEIGTVFSSMRSGEALYYQSRSIEKAMRLQIESGAYTDVLATANTLPVDLAATLAAKLETERAAYDEILAQYKAQDMSVQAALQLAHWKMQPFRWRIFESEIKYIGRLEQ